MNPFEMTVVIVLIVTIGRVLRARYGDTPDKSLKAMKTVLAKGGDRAEAEAENQRLQAEVARLNDRIQVLERLATDPAKRLSDEIDALKDK
jgi:cation transport ATPase